MEEILKRIRELEEELRNLPSATESFDTREEKTKKEYPNSKKGELMQNLDETKDAYQRTEIIKQLRALIESEIKEINDYITELNGYETQKAYIEQLEKDAEQPGLDPNERINILQEIEALRRELKEPIIPSSIQKGKDDKIDEIEEDDIDDYMEYAKALEIYEEDRDKLFALQAEYEEGNISYSEYENYAIYMVGREKFMMEWYNKLVKETSEEKESEEENPYKDLTDEELEKKLAELNAEDNEEYQFRAHEQNGTEENENDDTVDNLKEQIKAIENELKNRTQKNNDKKTIEKPENCMFIEKDDKKVDKSDEIDEYGLALEIYKEDRDKLFELQTEYEKGNISYSEYENYAIYMVGREKFMMEWYNKLVKETSEEKESEEENPYKDLTDEELEKKLAELNAEYNEEYQFRAHEQNGMEENENDDTLDKLLEQIKTIENELNSRKDLDKKLTENELSQELLDLNFTIKKMEEELNRRNNAEELNRAYKDLTDDELTEKLQELYGKYTEKYDDLRLNGVRTDDDADLLEIQAQIDAMEAEKSERKDPINTLTNEELEKKLEELKNKRKAIEEEVKNNEKKNNKKLQIEKPEPCMFIKDKGKGTIQPVPEQKALIGLRQQILDLQADDIVTNRQSKRYSNSEAKVFNFKASKGKLFHNIFRGTMASIGCIPVGAKKIWSKLFTSKETKEKMKRIKERVDKLTDAEILALREQLVTDRMLNEDFPLSVLDTIEERYSEIQTNKRIEGNVDIQIYENQRQKYIEEIKSIDEKLKDMTLDAATKTYLMTKKEACVKIAWQKQQEIIKYREGQQESTEKNAGDAESKKHAFSEDLRANKTGMNRIGYGKNKNDPELDKKLADLETARLNADKEGDLYTSVMAYDEDINLQKENTKLKTVFPGLVINRGARQYSEIIRETDYREDDLLKNALTTAIIVSSIWSVVKNIQMNRALAEQEKLIEQKNSEIIKANQENLALEGQGKNLVEGNQQMSELATGDDVIAKGLANETYRDGSSYYTQQEITALDKEGSWVKAVTDKNSNYHLTDAARHADPTYTGVGGYQEQASQIISDYTSGKMSYSDCIQELANVTGESQATMATSMQEALEAAKSYTSGMPGAAYDYSSYIRSLEGGLKSVGASSQMMQRFADIVNKAVQNARLVSGSATLVDEIAKIEIEAALVPGLIATGGAVISASKAEKKKKTKKSDKNVNNDKNENNDENERK